MDVKDILKTMSETETSTFLDVALNLVDYLSKEVIIEFVEQNDEATAYVEFYLEA